MVKAHSLILFALLSIGYHRIVHVDGLSDENKDIIQKFVKYEFRLLQIGGDLYTGNVLKAAIDTLGMVSDLAGAKSPEEEINDQAIEVAKDLESLSGVAKTMKEEVINELITSVLEYKQLKENWDTISDVIIEIDNYYDDYIDLKNHRKTYLNSTFTDFKIAVLESNINKKLRKLHNAIRRKMMGRDSALTILARGTQDHLHLCKRKQSLQIILYLLLNSALLTEIRAMIIVEEACRIHNNATYHPTLDRMKRYSLGRIETTIKNVKEVMSDSKFRILWACNVENRNDKISTKLDNFLQKYVTNDVHLQPERDCRDGKIIYERNEVKKCLTHDNDRGSTTDNICQGQKLCNGILLNCEFLGLHSLCKPISRNSTRRYEFITEGISGGDRIYGLTNIQNKCTVLSKSYPKILYGGDYKHCYYRLCTCDEKDSKESDRFVNLRPVIADDTFVVTGLRFRKENHVLHLQIKQGKLLKGATVDVDTNNWKPIEDYMIYKPLNGKLPKENEDYFKMETSYDTHGDINHALNFTNKAAINLDDVDFASETDPVKLGLLDDYENRHSYVVTGVRIIPQNVIESGVHLNLQLRMTRFNFATGELEAEKSLWYSKVTTNGEVDNDHVSNRYDMKLYDLNLPTFTPDEAIPVSPDNSFLKFTTSSRNNDAGQTTIPLIDLLSVETNPPVPLSGAGFCHKSSRSVLKNGGYLALKLFTFNYEPFINATYPQSEFESELFNRTILNANQTTDIPKR